MTDSDPFESPKLKVERAKHHICDYRAASKTLFEANIIRAHPEVNPETGDLVMIVRLSEPMPGILRLTAADALYNLRSALDQTVCRCAVLAGKSPKETYFPHGPDKAGFEISLRTKCKKVPEPVRRAIAALEPYYGGNGYLLRVLHDLNLVDKHTELITVGAALRSISLSPGDGSIPAGEVWRRTEDGFEVGDPATPVDQNMKITMAVTFTDVAVIQGESVTKILNQLCDLISRTVAIIESAMLSFNGNDTRA